LAIQYRTSIVTVAYKQSRDLSDKRGATFFLTHTSDKLTATISPACFKIRKPQHAYAEQLDIITNYKQADIIDLPGRWGRRGTGVSRRGSLFTWRIGFNEVSELVEISLKSGQAGLFRALDTSTKLRTTVLCWNRGGDAFQPNQDVFIVLGGYTGPVTII
jgi:hypothetical protein